MSKHWTLNQESFDRLLAWLDPDREESARKYEKIRQALIQIFTWRNLPEAEELADETINRVTQRINEIASQYTGDPARYFYGVAKNLIKEYERKQRAEVALEGQELALVSPKEDVAAIDLTYECLRVCLEQLSPSKRELVLAYYLKEKQAKIDYRDALAQRLNVNPNALRVQVHRIRISLQSCIEKCLRKHAEE
jgi:RNA polymerase sigma factor (sigma-70 family)